MENFVVSARKYRPQSFASVIGQGHITSTLKNAIAREQLSHAYLFCGPRGVGKTTCARIFAKAINCTSPVDNEPCDNCASCQGFNESRSFNIHELDAASNNSVDDIRTLTDQVRIPPQVGKYSVYIIDEVHMLSSQAFNAFLKTLEEPPQHAIFILATTEKHKIIPTILSRCQIFDFNRIKVDDTVEYLKYITGKEGVTADEQSLSLIATKADGAMRDALSIYDKVVSFCGTSLEYNKVSEAMNVLDYDTYFTLTDIIVGGDYTKALLLFDQVLKKGFSVQTFLSGLAAHFRDLLMAKNEQTSELLELIDSVKKRYKQQSVELDSGFLFSGISLLVQTQGSLKTASSQRLNTELSLMKLCRLGQKKNNDPLDEDFELPELLKIVQEPVAVKPKQETPKVKVVEQEPVQELVPEPRVEEPKKQSATPKVSISGQSIGAILNKHKSDVSSDPAQEKADAVTVKVDPESEIKINESKERFLGVLAKKRPRLGVAFSEMVAQGNRIKIVVPSDDLRQEVERCQQDVLMLLMQTSNVDGALELDIEVVEKIGNFAPIKVDDKLKFLTDKNPLLNNLRKELDLDLE